MLARRHFLRVIALGGAATLAAAPSLAEALQLVAFPAAAPVVADYEIRLFGALQVEAFGRRLDAAPRPDVTQLLTVLAHHPEGLSFAELGARLLPGPGGFDPDAFHRVSKTLHAARTWAGERLIRSNDNLVRFDTDLQVLVDVQLWQALLDRADGTKRQPALEMAIRLYRGSLQRGLWDPFTSELRSEYRLEFAAVANEVGYALRDRDPERAEVLTHRAQSALANEWAERVVARRLDRIAAKARRVESLLADRANRNKPAAARV